jgi:hypothetical protein
MGENFADAGRKLGDVKGLCSYSRESHYFRPFFFLFGAEVPPFEGP